MGQKVNSNILRMQISKSWPSKYCDKNKEELSNNIYQDLKLRKFLDIFFSDFNIFIHSCYITRSFFKLKINISYLITPSTLLFFNKTKIKTIKTSSYKTYKIKKLKVLAKQKKIKNKKSWLKKKELIYFNSFVNKLSNSLFLFTKKTKVISLVFQNLNKGLSNRFTNIKLRNIKSLLFNIRFYKKNKFFQESLNIILLILQKKNSAKLLSNYISYQLSLTKKHNYFITYFKKVLCYIIDSKIFNLKGVKILINGRVNGLPRSRSLSISAGTICNQTFSKHVDFFLCSSHTLNGTLGIKVWVE